MLIDKKTFGDKNPNNPITHNNNTETGMIVKNQLRKA